MRYLLLLVILAAGCAYQPAFGDLTCAEEGAVRDGQRCEDGVWIADGEGDVGPSAPDARFEDSGPTPVNDVGPSGDVGPNVPDTTVPVDTDLPDADVSDDANVPDMEPDACVPESDAEFCAGQGAVCGNLTAVDNCGMSRSVSCGTCGDNAACASNVCTCNPGFVLDAGQCKPPCEVNNPCDINATCSGDRVCTCNDGYVGDGVTCSEIAAPSIVATVTDRRTGLSDLSAGPLTAQAGDLYVAIIGINGTGSVAGVTGLGLTWTQAVEQCSVTNARQVEVWYARGTANASNGAVSVDVTGVRTDAAVVVYQITNVANAGPGSVVARNGRGDNGCGTGSFHDSYNYTVMRQNPNSLMLSALVSRGNHNPGAGWTEDEEPQRGSAFSLSTMHQQPTGNNVTVSGSMRDSYWVSVTAEIFGN